MTCHAWSHPPLQNQLQQQLQAQVSATASMLLLCCRCPGGASVHAQPRTQRDWHPGGGWCAGQQQSAAATALAAGALHTARGGEARHPARQQFVFQLFSLHSKMSLYNNQKLQVGESRLLTLTVCHFSSGSRLPQRPNTSGCKHCQSLVVCFVATATDCPAHFLEQSSQGLLAQDT